VRLRVCARVGSSAAAGVGRQRGLCHCRLLGAVVLLQEVCVFITPGPRTKLPVQALERAGGGGQPNLRGPGGRCLAARPAERGGQRCPERQQTWRWSCMMRRDE
jgi:hypothetical protein